MFDHVGLNVQDFERSRAFYQEALEPLGLKERAVFEESKSAGFGPEGKYGFWIVQREPYGIGTHVAFTAPDRAAVDAFHAAGVAAGGTDNGAPGIRERYHSAYYAAFVHDPDGNNIEAVCHSG
jgi:catechol 2,3-dioxygenase-like lactoylglutathione lyase family enzyme